MEMIIGRLEEANRRRSEIIGSQEPSVALVDFAPLKGKLPCPIEGKIMVSFGYSVDPITNLKSFSPGISVKGKVGRSVVSVADGQVAYVGDLRGYGNFIIINHDGSHYTTYAGLGETFVSEGTLVKSGTRLAISGENGIVRFELRRGREPLDPLEWFVNDAY